MKEPNKWVCALGYIIFFIPLLIDGDLKEYKFHANQGLNLFIFFMAISLVGSFIPVIGWFLILPLGGLISFILFIVGVINSINMNMKELPVIGKSRFIK